MPNMSLKAQEFSPETTGIAACAYKLSAGSSIQLLPAGKFRAVDGRPHDALHWHVNAELAAEIIEREGGFGNSFVIDYEHQTMLTAQNGQPAPAAGWFKKLEWRRAGLYAIGVKWTERAAAMIKAGEYGYSQRGYAIGFSWKDVWQQEHQAAFTVAKAIQLDILRDIWSAIDGAQANGTTFADFQEE